MTKPYIDKFKSENQIIKYAIHSLSIAQLQIILSALDWKLNTNTNAFNKAQIIDLINNLNNSFLG